MFTCLLNGGSGKGNNKNFFSFVSPRAGRVFDTTMLLTKNDHAFISNVHIVSLFESLCASSHGLLRSTHWGVMSIPRLYGHTYI